MKMKTVVSDFLVFAIAALTPAFALQWEGYPTPGIPRTPDGKVDLNAALPRTSDGKPDLTGIWQASRGAFNFSVGLKAGETVPFNAEGKKLFDERQANNSKDDPGSRCLPNHIAMRNQLNTPFKFVQLPGVTIQLYESRTSFRQIFTDGRPLPKVDWPTWGGFSIGRWEGNTFVVVTAGFNGKSWLDQAGHPASEAMRLTERFTRKDFGHMELETIIDDPKVYSKPWSTFAQFTIRADTELLEFICEENERDSQFMIGK